MTFTHFNFYNGVYFPTVDEGRELVFPPLGLIKQHF